MIKVNNMWIKDTDKFFAERIAADGTFEYDKLAAALKYVFNWECAIDCGAHYGTWTIPMSKRFKQIISFEGNEDTYECLAKNTQKYNNITINNMAVGDRFDNVKIGIGEHKGKAGNSGINTVIGDGDIKMIPIDSLNINSLGFLKLDIEGYELFALRGAEKTIKRCKPIVIFEENFRCEEHGIAMGEAGRYLVGLGMKHLVSIRADNIYGWK